MPKISICLPVYISSETDLNYLQQNLSSLKAQKFVSIEIVVSDATVNEKWAQQVNKMVKTVALSKYIRAKGLNIGQNLNSAIQKATCDIVKVIFQDDFLISEYALLMLFVRLRISKRKWHISACNHYSEIRKEFYRYHRPKISQTLLLGGNTLSSPSVVTFYRSSFVQLSDSLNYLVDCDWYLRMSHQNGLPIFGVIPLVSNRIHATQASNWAHKFLEKEKILIEKMHISGYMNKYECICLINKEKENKSDN